jgi:3-hydroxyisobutyrate dehydrogenase-like beta-hydroxyacid dehydrogenase
VSSGYPVRAYDVLPGKTAAAAAAGAASASSAADAAKGADFVLLNRPTTEAVEQAVFGDAGVAGSLRTPQLVIDFSTIKVEKCKAFAHRLRSSTGCGWIDAPVSGGPPAAEAGTLAIMAGGEEAQFAQVRSLLADLGHCTRMGTVGAGQVTKMVNQVLVLTNYCVLAEALSLAEAGGVDAARIPEALGAGYAGSMMLERLYPRMVARDFAPAGYAFQVLKDLDLVQALAKELTVPTPMASQAASLFRMLNAKGHGQLDGIAVLKLFEKEQA